MIVPMSTYDPFTLARIWYGPRTRQVTVDTTDTSKMTIRVGFGNHEKASRVVPECFLAWENTPENTRLLELFAKETPVEVADAVLRWRGTVTKLETALEVGPPTPQTSFEELETKRAELETLLVAAAVTAIAAPGNMQLWRNVSSLTSRLGTTRTAAERARNGTITVWTDPAPQLRSATESLRVVEARQIHLEQAMRTAHVCYNRYGWTLVD